MNPSSNLSLRLALTKYTIPSTRKALSIFIVDLALYFAFIILAVVSPLVVTKFIFSMAAGFMISQLFVVGHDAAHGSFTSRKCLNKAIAKIAFLPSLHNYYLWLYVHNKDHHRLPNTHGINSWFPLSKQEFDQLPTWRKYLEKIYRGPLGFGPYYLCERWWKHKFIPFAKVGSVSRMHSWINFMYISLFLSLVGIGSVYLANLTTHTGAAFSLILTLVIPFVFWNYAMGFTIYQHHTNPRARWFKDKEDYKKCKTRSEEVTAHIKYPRWYNVLTHNIMEHPAHHVDARIPLYNLHKAEEELEKICAHRMIIEKFSLLYIYDTLRKCKLYDYENHCWLDFNGRRTEFISHTGDIGYHAYPIRR